MLTHNSWADALHAATTPEQKAEILLTRAQQRQSKRLICEDLQEALNLLHPTEPYTPEIALQWYNLPYSQAGLHELAKRLHKRLTE